MNLKLYRPLVIFDIESTGTDAQKDRIIELGILKIHPSLSVISWNQRFNPDCQIPKEASDVHGITDADVADMPFFRDKALKIKQGLDNCDLAGFNIKAYDLPLLQAEFDRSGLVFEWKGRALLDMAVIFKRKEERTLSAAVKFYLNKNHEEAHGAIPDCKATLDVLLAQIERYGLPNDVQNLDSESRYDDEEEKADLCGKLIYVDGKLTYNFGKEKGKAVKDEKSYARWMLNNDFSCEVKQLIREELGL